MTTYQCIELLLLWANTSTKEICIVTENLWYILKIHLLQKQHLHYEQPYGFFDFKTVYVENYNFQHVFDYKFNNRLLVDNIPLTYREIQDARTVSFINVSEYTIDDKYNIFKKKIYMFRLRWDRWQKHGAFDYSDNNEDYEQGLIIADKWLNSCKEDEYTKWWTDYIPKSAESIKSDKLYTKWWTDYIPKSAESIKSDKLVEINYIDKINKFAETDKSNKILNSIYEVNESNEIDKVDEIDQIYDIDKIVDKHDEFIEMYKLTFKDFNNKLFRSGSTSLDESFISSKFDKINGSFDENQFDNWSKSDPHNQFDNWSKSNTHNQFNNVIDSQNQFTTLDNFKLQSDEIDKNIEFLDSFESNDFDNDSVESFKSNKSGNDSVESFKSNKSVVKNDLFKSNFHKK